MTVEDLHKLSSRLIKSFNQDDIIEIDGNVIIVYHENPITGGSKIEIDIQSLIDDVEENAEEYNEVVFDSVNWDGISKVRAWTGAGKQRIYFNAVGIPVSAHTKGRVFLELVHGEWMPNMKYKLMQELANQLNSLKLFDAEKVQQLYEEFLQNC